MSRRTASPVDRRRGRHKKRASRETRQWELEHLPAAPPAWMPASTAARLLELRRELDPLAGPPGRL